MTQAYGYIRCSGLGQMSGDGPERQQAAISAFAIKNDYQIVEWFQEPITGKSDLDGRIQFQAMRSAMLAGTVKTVVIEKLDRLARDLMIQEQFIADFQRSRLEILSTTEPDLCSQDPTRVLMRQIMGCFAQYERSIIVSRTRSARDRIRARNVRCEGAAPYGYRVVGSKGEKRLEEVREEQIVITEIKWLYHGSNWSLQAIARYLNDKNRPTRRVESRWFPAQVKRIIDRPKISQKENGREV